MQADSAKRRRRSSLQSRSRNVAFAQFIAFSWFVYAYNPSVVLLRYERQLDYAVAGIQTVLFSLGVVAGSAAYPRLLRSAGIYRTGLAAAAALGVGVVLFAADADMLVVSLGSFLAGIGAAAVIAAASSSLADAGSVEGMARLSLANAAGSLASMLALLTVSASVAANLGWRLPLVAIVPALIALQIWDRHRRTLPLSVPGVGPSQRMPKTYRLTVLAVTLLVAAEMCFGLWGPDLVASLTGAAAAERTAALAALFAGSAVGRLIAAKAIRLFRADSLFRASNAIALASFGILWTSTDSGIVLLSLFLLGATLSFNLPFGQARAVLASGGRADQASAGVFFALGLAGLSVPFILAVLADSIGIRDAFLVVPLLLISGFLTMRRATQRLDQVAS
ncbi:MAG: MFS transporter [Acidimicrobiia bacterium]